MLEVYGAGAGPEMFFLKFDNEELGCPFLLQRWAPRLSISVLEPALHPQWIWLTNIPTEYWHTDGIEYLASGIGKPLRVDDRTFSPDNVGGARILVECAANLELSKKIEAVREDGKEFVVELRFEFYLSQCSTCSIFGHSASTCPHNTTTNGGRGEKWGGRRKACEEKSKNKCDATMGGRKLIIATETNKDKSVNGGRGIDRQRRCES